MDSGARPGTLQTNNDWGKLGTTDIRRPIGGMDQVRDYFLLFVPRKRVSGRNSVLSIRVFSYRYVHQS
jgi:hypothetical protein